MPGYDIRPIEAADWATAWTLRLRALHDHPDAFGQPFAWAASLDQDQVRETFLTFWTGGDNQVFVAVSPAGELAGMAGIARESRATEAHRAFVWGVYVAPEARGHRLGDRLLHAVVEWARSRDGVLQIHLEVNSANGPAIRSYERAGFRRTGHIPRARILDGIPIHHDEMVLLLDTPEIREDAGTKGLPA